MIKDAKLKEMELYYDTGRLVTDACFSIKNFYRGVPHDLGHALNRFYRISDDLEEVLIMIGEGYSEVWHEYITTLNEMPRVQHKETINYVDALLDKTMDAFDKGRVKRETVTESLNSVLLRVNHNLFVLNRMKEEEK